MSDIESLIVLNDLDIWSLLIGVGLPAVVSVLKRPTFPKWATSVLTLILFTLAGIITVYLLGALSGASWVRSSLLIAISSLTFYRNFWKPTGLDARITNATSGRQIPTVQ